MSSSTPWDDTFDTALREALPQLSELAALTPDVELRGYGMDSLATLRVLIEIEGAYDISVPDECLASATFATPAALWAVVETLLPRAA